MRQDTMFGVTVGFAAGLLIIHYLLLVKLGIGIPDLFDLPHVFNVALDLLGISLLILLVLYMVNNYGQPR